jgi:hypothetical protein
MPEEPEVDTDSLRETITEPPEGALLRNIALTTAMLAAVPIRHSIDLHRSWHPRRKTIGPPRVIATRRFKGRERSGGVHPRRADATEAEHV